ncbi:MAG: hypothetical protein KAI66_00050 [Lentisphaeria bacterium]|nr:hypothetical protein [Lentisphaeria bacterium]
MTASQQENSVTQFRAGVGRADITDYDAGAVNDPLYVKALALSNGATTVVLVTVDAVALGEIGRIGNEFVPNVRSRIHAELGLDPENMLMGASHCHGTVCADAEDLAVQAVMEACGTMVPVTIGAGAGHEDRIMENRRLKLKNGREADVRHAYSLPPDEEVAAVGPVDPEIGVLRLDREDGRPLAVVYNFACHPIQTVPNGGNTADIAGFASQAIEDSLGHDATALFLQGCGGDINPVFYKDVDHPRDAEPLGSMLGLSVLKALGQISCDAEGELRVVRETLELPRADLRPFIEATQTEQMRLLQSLAGTSIDLKEFLHLVAKHSLSPDFPSYASHRYLYERALGRDDLKQQDARNKSNVERYRKNILVMEQLTRLQVNLGLLKMHQAQNEAAGSNTIEIEILALKVGDFVMVTFPGELSVQIGLGIKSRAPRKLTFVATNTNGYIYYAPTAEQLENRGNAQEDSDSILAPEWQALFEEKVHAMLARL